jgi:hypothetical protein
VDICEVDEGVADVATRLEIDAKVHEVIGAEALLIKDSLEGQLQQWLAEHWREQGGRTNPVHLVGYVAKHDGGAHVAAIEDALAANTVVLVSGMTIEGLTGERVDSRAIADETTLIIDTRLDAVGRVDGAVASPESRVESDPLERFLETEVSMASRYDKSG